MELYSSTCLSGNPNQSTGTLGQFGTLSRRRIRRSWGYKKMDALISIDAINVIKQHQAGFEPTNSCLQDVYATTTNQACFALEIE